jgi:hypothetical protein
MVECLSFHFIHANNLRAGSDTTCFFFVGMSEMQQKHHLGPDFLHLEKEKNHSTQDSRVVPHRGTN